MTQTQPEHLNASAMTQAQLEQIKAPDMTPEQLEHAKAYIKRLVDSCTDTALLDLIAKLFLNKR